MGVVGAITVRAAVAGNLAADRGRGPVELPGDLGVPESGGQAGRDVGPVLVGQPASGHPRLRAFIGSSLQRVAFSFSLIAQIAMICRDFHADEARI